MATKACLSFLTKKCTFQISQCFDKAANLILRLPSLSIKSVGDNLIGCHHLVRDTGEVGPRSQRWGPRVRLK